MQLDDFGRFAGAGRGYDRDDALGGLAERVVEQVRIWKPYAVSEQSPVSRERSQHRLLGL